MFESETISTFIPSSWNKSTTKVDVSIETMPLLSREIGCDPMDKVNQIIQTDIQHEDKLSARGVVISQETVDMIIDAIEESSKINKYFQRLEEYKNSDKVQLVQIKKFSLDTTEKLPIINLKCGKNNKIAMLFGYTKHDSWCSHTGHVIIHHKNKSTTIHLGSCPNQVIFGSQQQLIIGTVTGEILLTYNDEILWQSDTIHSQCITCLKWVSPNLLFSSGLDGRLVLLSLKSTSLEAIKSNYITVSDLPKSMRRSNNNSRKTGIVDVTEFKKDYFLAGETGAIFSLDTETLDVQSMGHDSDGIEQLTMTENDGFISVTPEKMIKSISSDGLNSELLIPNVKITSNLCIKNNLLIFINNNAVDGVNKGSIIGYDLSKNEVIFQQSSDLFLSVDVNENNEIVAIDKNYFINIFKFAE